ncbi:helix-turn-helix domain-containing protein [Phascolarctobacterium succinatutens]|uniref:helix-turn-helix domain-containing protein n=1 Tax=Phascolarctobacterium succinatutens TaxID=626940 RepID=UPI0026658C44|nr:helix-turn-helix transcriptional regulator [Phascolarctobacterium succinatutens]
MMPIEDIKRNFSETLKAIMQKHGKTQGDLVKDLNFRQATVSDWLNGKKYPRMDKIEKLANYFDISINELLLQSVTVPVPASSSLSLTQQEETHIKKYRQLDADGKEEIDDIIDVKLAKLQRKAEEDVESLG